MSINATTSSAVSRTSATQTSKTTGSESSKKSSEASFKDEMSKVTSENGNNVNAKENDNNVNAKENGNQKLAEEKNNSVDSAKDVSNSKEPVANNTNNVVNKDEVSIELKNFELQHFDKNGGNTVIQDSLNKQNVMDLQASIAENDLQDANLTNTALQESLQKQNLLQEQEVSDVGKNSHIQDSMQNQGLLAEQQALLSEKEALLSSAVETKVNRVESRNKRGNKQESLEDDSIANLEAIQLAAEIENNYNIDNHKTENEDVLNGNVIFNNALASFEFNNIELSNDIQQMINTAPVKNVNLNGTTVETGMITLNSTNKISMTQSDAEFFVNLTQDAGNNNISVQNITTQANEMTQNGANAKAVEKNVQVSQALLDALTEARENNQPLRIDFDQNVSVILRVNKDGVLAANFIPHDKAVEQYLRNNIEGLKNTFSENDLPYSDLSYSNRGSKQQKEQQRNKQQQ